MYDIYFIHSTIFILLGKKKFFGQNVLSFVDRFFGKLEKIIFFYKK